MSLLLGIVNLTVDSFSDGGRFLAATDAIAHGEAMLTGGADGLDLGAESSNPDGARVPAELELARLLPVLEHFVRAGVRVAVDTHKPAVMRAVLARGAWMINDVTALRSPGAAQELAAHPEALAVLMFARQQGYRAVREEAPHEGLIEELSSFFTERIAELEGAGVAAKRLVLDPGMGFFLGANAEPSLFVLRRLRALRALGRPLYVSVSRKSFLGSVLGGRPPGERAAATLGAELWALSQGVDYVRTHDPAALSDAWRVWQTLATTPG